MTHTELIQEPLIHSLADPSAWPFAVDEVEVVETHISWVLLVGAFAYKIKKPVDFGFLDFSTLEKRKHFCEEELRINRRLAPDIYLEMVAISGSPERPDIAGQGEAFEYAVKMRRFPADGLLSHRPGELTPELMDRLARQIADFHSRIETCPQEEPWGAPDLVLHPMVENFHHIGQLEHDPDLEAQLKRLETWTRHSHARLADTIARRKRDGFVRECHGDMHLGNITLVDGDPVIFDAIEFNPALRWIDLMNEIAFLTMDLDEKGRPELAQRVLNHYLEQSGDYEGLALLRFYQVYRAMVRAKVTALRLGQSDLEAGERESLIAEFRKYLQLAERYTHGGTPGIIITHGASGSGKSRAARKLVLDIPAIQVRSDVERKRLAGLDAQARTHAEVAGGIYSGDFTRRTYDRLLVLAEAIIAAGFVAVADATFLRREQRRPFQELAQRLKAPFLILEMQTPETVLRKRVRARLEKGKDPSEANEAVLSKQLEQMEPLVEEERVDALSLVPDQPLPFSELKKRFAVHV